MKNLKAPFLVIALLLNVLLMSAGSSRPPTPTPTAKSANTMGTLDDDDRDCEIVNCEADFPIDQNISFLLVGGIALGAIAIYKNQTKKASI